jgi:hypothetical protein
MPAVEVANRARVGHDAGMQKIRRVPPAGEPNGHELISLAQKLARDAEHHALLSASLASQADRLMVAGLEKLRQPHAPASPRHSC